MNNETYKILVQLVQRKRKDYDFAFWHSYEFSIKYPSVFECFLCGAKYHSIPSIEEHGMQHLKESNLLPFI